MNDQDTPKNENEDTNSTSEVASDDAVETGFNTASASIISSSSNSDSFTSNSEFSELLSSDTAKFNSLISSKSLNETEKSEVKELLKTELEVSILTLKGEIKKELQDTKKDFLTFFGLFTSFVTFLSIEVQLFKNKENIFELMGVSFISFAFVTFFAIILNDIGREKHSFKDFIKPSYVIICIFLIAGLSCLFYGGSKEPNKIKKLEAKVLDDSIQILKIKKEIKNAHQQSRKMDSLFNTIKLPKVESKN